MRYLIPIFLAFILVGTVSAAGISSPYWEDHPLSMGYGETKVVELNFQNMVGDSPVTIELNLRKGGNIAFLDKTTYTAQPKTHDTIIPLTISIPEGYDGGIQTIELEAKTVSGDTAGMVVLNSGWIVSFNVIVSEKDVPKSTLTWIIVGLILILIIILVLVLLIIRNRR